MSEFDFDRNAAGRRGAPTGIRLSLAKRTVATETSRPVVAAGGMGMNDTDRAVGAEAMR